MTWASRHAGRSHDIVFAVSIQGVKHWLIDRSARIPSSLLGGRPSVEVVVETVFGETTLDMQRRRQIGGSLNLLMRDNADQFLRALFRARRRPDTHLAVTVARTTAMSGSGVLTLKDTSSLPASGEVYIGAETFAYTGKAGATLTGVSRAQHSSRPQTHLGGSDTGAGIYVAPSSWVGRRVYVWSGYVADDGLVHDVAQVGTFRIEESPSHQGDETWELQCSEMSDWFGEARIYVGQRTIQSLPQNDRWSRVEGDTFDAYIPGDSLSLLHTGTAATYALFEVELGLSAIREIVPTILDLRHRPAALLDPAMVPVSNNDNETNGMQTARRWSSVSHVAYLHGDPALITLRLMLSRTGDESNGPHDVLPGYLPEGNGDESWRMGAAFDEADVDAPAFEALIGQSMIQWTHLLSKEMPITTVLDEMCFACRCFWYITAQGKLSVAKLRERVPVSVATRNVALDDDMIDANDDEGSTFSEREVVSGYRISANFDPVQDKHLAIVGLRDHDVANRYPEASIVEERESSFVSVNTTQFAVPASDSQRLVRLSSTDFLSLQVQLRRLQSAQSRAPLYYTATAHWPASVLQVGDVVRVDSAQLVDGETSKGRS
jgi:hypothetical protein